MDRIPSAKLDALENPSVLTAVLYLHVRCVELFKRTGCDQDLHPPMKHTTDIEVCFWVTRSMNSLLYVFGKI